MRFRLKVIDFSVVSSLRRTYNNQCVLVMKSSYFYRIYDEYVDRNHLSDITAIQTIKN